MTVPNETARTRYAGNGATTDFSTGFVFQSNDQVRVIFVDAAGAETEWTENTQYTLTGANTGAAGTVAVATAPTDYTVQTGEYLVVILDVEGTQPLDGGALTSVSAEQLEAILDNVQLQINQLREQLSRALLSAEGGAGGTPDNLTSWSPVLAVVVDGDRRVFQVADWSGGTGTKPDVGAYVGEDGLVAAIGDGVDVRGMPGASGAGTGDVVAANNLSDLASAIAARDNLSVHGADKASAATVNLDTATGDIVDITGTTTITAITLTEGRQRVARFTGILTLTNNANIILPGGASITTAAGDFAIFAGYAAGVVRCLSYVRANGKPVVNPTLSDLGAGTVATHAATEFLLVNQDLADLNDPATARSSLELGTAAILDVGTTANKILQLDGSAKIPAVDGSQLTNLPGTGQPIPTSSSFAVGTMAIFANASAGDMVDGSSNAGSGLRLYAGGSGGNVGSPNYEWTGPVAQTYGITPSGTWKNVTGRTVQGLSSGANDYSRYGYFVRTA
jgi:hypothetical protein